ncbi:MAG: OmpA family protein [Thiotrichales bacterium]
MNARLPPVLLGLAAFALIAYFCVAQHAARIEREIQGATQQALVAGGLGWVNAITDGRDVILSGFAPDSAARGAAAEMIAALPGVNGVKNRIEIARVEPVTVQSSGPYVATVTLRDDRVTLNGAIPSDAERQALLQVARARFGADNVIDRLEVAPGAPSKFALALEEAVLNQLAGFIEATGKVTDNLIELDGVVRGTSDGERLQAVASLSVPRDYSLRFNARALERMTPEELASLGVTNAVTCQARLNSAIAETQIQFETGKAVIMPDNRPLLTRLATIARECREMRIEIAGHTDNAGAAELNQRLSKQRAEAVRSYLIAHGIEAGRLTAQGYGATRPIADNSSAAGQATNRRIEFIIQGN